MMFCSSRLFLSSVLATAALLLSAPLATAQWASDSTTNTVVCDTVGQQDYPKGCTDGAEGAIFAWEDGRNGVFQIYAQHLDASGRATWKRNGVKVCTQTGSASPQTMPIITSDDSGGAYIVWSDARFAVQFGTCLFAQHILSNGTLAYPDSALPVAIGINGCNNPTICDDGRGGAYVAWEDNRTNITGSRPDIWMNRLWRNGVKFGLATTGTKGTITTINIGTHSHPKYITYFHDSAAHFKPYMINLSLTIVGKGSFSIAAVTSDTQLDLKSYPGEGTYSYYVQSLLGLPVDTFQNKQTGPVLTNDGLGGCFLAWTSNASNPNGIYATHIDSNGVQLWDPAPNPGFLIYASENTSNPSKNVSINRDSNELMLTWEVTNSSTGHQEVYAQRMRNNSLTDTVFEWARAIEVSADGITDQMNPRIFSDDSSVLGARGAVIPFIFTQPGSASDFDVAMRRIEGDGGTLLPPAGNGPWFVEQKPNGQMGMKSVKLVDPDPTRTGILAVWNDAWDGQDTMIFAQRIDRNGRKYFPTPGTSSKWGLAISGDSGSHPWNAKQVTLVARDNGAIAAWTDFRNGNADIYAQLIVGDGYPASTIDLSPPITSVLSTEGSVDSVKMPCNARCTEILAKDTGEFASGIASIAAMTLTNMKFSGSSFTPGAASAQFGVCVIDSMQNGFASVNIKDVSGNNKMETVTYCTIADTLAPAVTWDSIPNGFILHFRDNRAWDRGLLSVQAASPMNVNFSPQLSTLKPGAKSFDVTVTQFDTTQPASFSIQASDTVGNTTASYSFALGATAGVTANGMAPVSVSILPNPVSGSALFELQGAPSAEVSIFDVLGREVDRFHIEGAYEWNAAGLTPGTYVVRIKTGTTVLERQFIHE